MSILVRSLIVLACLAALTAAYISRESRLIQADVFVQFVKDQNKEKALERLDDAKRLNPESSIEIARARLVTPQQGVKFLEDAVAREPENAVLWVRLAQHQRNAGMDADAQRSYARARELDSQLPPEGPPPGN
jgi:predicted Zn-dependent protease